MGSIMINGVEFPAVRVDELPAISNPDIASARAPAMLGGTAGHLTVDQIREFLVTLVGLATDADLAAAIAVIKGTATAGFDTLGEIEQVIMTLKGGVSTSFDTLAEIANALGLRLRVDAAQGLSPLQKGQARVNADVAATAGFRDKIINGDGRISQITYTTVADDTYWCDQHYVLTQTAAITPTIIADVADGLPSMMRLTQTQTTAQRMGNAQIVEAAEAKRLRGKQVTLGGILRNSSGQAIRYAVLEWTGTADVVTSDVVLNWASGSYGAGGFFLASNITVAAVGSITPTAAILAEWDITANISSACNNIMVVYWTEGTAAQNVTLDMVWGLVPGDATLETWPYASRHPQQEMSLCQRYLYRVNWVSGGVAVPGGGHIQNTTSAYLNFAMPVAMRIPPSFSFGGTLQLGIGGANVSVTGITTSYGSEIAQALLVATTGVVAGQSCELGLPSSAEWVMWDARL